MVGASAGPLLLVDRGVVGGRLQQRRQQGRLADGQLGGRLVEEGLRGRLHAIGAGAEIDPVQIQGQDLLLGILVLQPDGEQQLLHLALEGLVGRQEQVARQLLGDGGGALGRVASVEVGQRGADDAHRIEAPVLVEAAILHRHEGGGHVERQGVDIDWRRVLAAAHRQQGAVPVQIADRGLAVYVVELGGVRQAAREHQHEGGPEDQYPDAQHHAPVDQGVEQGSAGRPGRGGLARRRTSAAGPAWGAIGVRHARFRLRAAALRGEASGPGALTGAPLQEMKGRIQARQVAASGEARRTGNTFLSGADRPIWGRSRGWDA